jgi:rhodanese-related sulfurtransferase
MAAATTAPALRPGDLARQLDDGAALHVLDVRTPAEFESAHIPGSHNLPLDQIRQYRADLVHTTAPVVAVCQQGVRSREAARLLVAAGHPAAETLEGGIAAWETAGLPLERGRQRWGMERQVRGVAGGLVLAGALGGLFVSRPLGALAAFVGGGLVFSALTNTCGMANLLARLPYNQDPSFDPAATVAALTGRTGGASASPRNGASD